MIPSEYHVFSCPSCNVKGKHDKILHESLGKRVCYTFRYDGDGKNHQAFADLAHIVYKCDLCDAETYFLYQYESYFMRPRVDGQERTTVDAGKVLHQYPISTPTQGAHMPPEIANSGTEAEKCLAVFAFNACGVMARRTMHAICDDKGAEGNDLYSQLKYLKEQHIITEDLWEWAEELRVVGRSGAHPEWEEVTSEDAEYAVRFLREILRYMYINPAERKLRRLKETKKKK